jgi:TRAP-type C4-dicarboxylate transport system permease small subunit
MTSHASGVQHGRTGSEAVRFRAGAVLANIPEAICGLSILAVTVVLFAGVVWRYVFVDPLSWTDEIARVLFVWLSFLGAAVGIKRGIHSAVNVFEARLSLRWQKAAALFAVAVMAVMAGVLVYTGTLETIVSTKEVLPVTSLSRAWQFGAVPISGLLMLIYLVPVTRQVLRGHVRTQSGVDGE